jgi:regulator of replication initiation timing
MIGFWKSYEKSRKLRQSVANFDEAVIKARAEVVSLEQQLAELRAENNWLRAEIDRKRSVRQQLRDTYHSLDAAIIRRIDQRGMAYSKKKRMPSIEAELLKSNNKQELLAVALEYDVDTYFCYRVRAKTMKLRYRVVSKLYRSARNASIHGVKQVHRMARRLKI